MAQLKYDKAKRMLWVKDGDEAFPIFTLANLNGNNTRLTSEGFLEVKNSNTESWEPVTDSDGQPISLMGAPGKDGETPVVELTEAGMLKVNSKTVNVIGPQGPQGPQGPKGDTGPQGEKGETGEKGKDGQVDYSVINSKQDKESNELLTTDKTVIGAINELYSKHSTNQSFAEVSVSYKVGDMQPHTYKLTYVPAGIYKVEGTLHVETTGTPEPFGGCAIYVSPTSDIGGLLQPYYLPDRIFQLNEEFTLTSDGHLYIVFADYDYLRAMQTEVDWQNEIDYDATVSLSNLALYTIETASTYSLRAPATVSYTQIPLESAVLIPKGQSFKKLLLLSKTISDLSWSIISEDISNELCKSIYTEIINNEDRQLDVCGKSYIQITVLEDKIQPQLPTLQELYDRQSVFYNYMKENTTAFLTVSDVDIIAEDDTWISKS